MFQTELRPKESECELESTGPKLLEYRFEYSGIKKNDSARRSIKSLSTAMTSPKHQESAKRRSIDVRLRKSSTEKSIKTVRLLPNPIPKKDHTKTMIKRWVKLVKGIPSVDLIDFQATF